MFGKQTKSLDNRIKNLTSCYIDLTRYNKQMTEEIEKLEKRVKELEEQPTCNCLNEVDAVRDYFWALMEYLKLDVDSEEHSGISATTDEPDTVISVKVIPAKKIK